MNGKNDRRYLRKLIKVADRKSIDKFVNSYARFMYGIDDTLKNISYKDIPNVCWRLESWMETHYEPKFEEVDL